VEQIMSDLKKADCISVQKVQDQLGVVRNTLNAYMNALGIQRHKFPFDSKAYITLTDYGRLRDFIEENRSDEE
jgi:hypothetical protein